jgi:hypothetical protein
MMIQPTNRRPHVLQDRKRNSFTIGVVELNRFLHSKAPQSIPVFLVGRRFSEVLLTDRHASVPHHAIVF